MKNKNNLRVVSLVFLSACLVFFSGCASQEMSDAPVVATVSGAVTVAFSDESPGTVDWGSLERGTTGTKAWLVSGDTFEIVNKGLVAAKIQLAYNWQFLTAGTSSWRYQPVCKLFGQGNDATVTAFPEGDTACSAGSMQSGYVDVPSGNHDTVECLKYTDDDSANPGIVINQELTVGIDEPLGDKNSTMVFTISEANPVDDCGSTQGYLNI